MTGKPISGLETANLLLEYEDSRSVDAGVNLYQYNLALLKSCGDDVRISTNVIIKRPEVVCIGNHVAIEAYFVCTSQLLVGDYCHISYAVTIIGGPDGSLKMGHFSHLSAGVHIICVTDLHLGDGLISPIIPEQFRDKVNNQPITVGNFATVGTGAVVTPGVTIGDGAVVGANSFVNKDIEPWTICVGSPAKPIKKRPSETMRKFARELGYSNL